MDGWLMVGGKWKWTEDGTVGGIIGKMNEEWWVDEIISQIINIFAKLWTNGLKH